VRNLGISETSRSNVQVPPPVDVNRRRRNGESDARSVRACGPETQDNADHRDMTRVLSTPSRAKILCRLRTAIFNRGGGERARRDSEEDRESSGHPFIQNNGFTSAPTVVGAPPEGETAAPKESISGQHPVAALVKKREEKRKHGEREREGKGAEVSVSV